MAAQQLDLWTFAKKARVDMLGAVEALPTTAALSRAPYGVPFVVAQQFSTAQQVLVTDADSYRKPWVIRSIIEDGLGKNLFTLDGESWLERRQPCAPVFGHQQMGSLATTINSSVTDLVSSWEEGEIEMQSAMTELTILVALRGLLGTTDDTEELAEVIQHDFEELLAWISFRFNRPTSLPALVPTPRNRRLAQSKKSLRTALRELMAHRRKHATRGLDVLSQLLRAQTDGDGDSVLTDDAIIDESIGFMFAGHETTAATLTWALYELARQPELQAIVAAEAGALIDADDLFAATREMTQTSAIIEETLRLYPAGISIARSAKRRTELAGETIRRGTFVLIPVYTIQRSAEVWENPNEFDPTRHIDGNGDGFLPFGLGPRRCLGARFARTEMRIALGHICRSWQLSYERAEAPVAVVEPSLRARDGITMRLSSHS